MIRLHIELTGTLTLSYMSNSVNKLVTVCEGLRSKNNIKLSRRTFYVKLHDMYDV